MADPSRRSSTTTPAMQVLDPSPVDDSPVNITRSDYFTTTSSSTSTSKSSPNAPQPTSRNGTGSSPGLFSHTPAFYLSRLQRYSSYAFTAFLTMHVTNTSLIPLLTSSIPASETYLLLTRPYYQSPLFEPLLVLGPLALHITSGLALRIVRRRTEAMAYGAETHSERRRIKWPRVSGTSALGFALTPLVAAHMFVNRITPLVVDGDSSGVGLGYVAHAFAKHPGVAFSAYVALVGVGAWHVAWGWAKWLGLSPETAKGADTTERELARKRRWYGVNGVAALLAGVWMAGGLGVVARGGETKGWAGRNFDRLFGSIPLVGGWLVS